MRNHIIPYSPLINVEVEKFIEKYRLYHIDVTYNIYSKRFETWALFPEYIGDKFFVEEHLKVNCSCCDNELDFDLALFNPLNLLTSGSSCIKFSN